MTNFRDVGSHVNLSARANGTTLTKRLAAGCPKARRITYLPHSMHLKTNFVESDVLSSSLYGCESTYANQSAVDKLTTAIGDVVAPQAKRRCLDIAFSLTHKEISPWPRIFMRRIIMLRRMTAKHPFILPQIVDLITHYLGQSFPGTIGSQDPDNGIMGLPALQGAAAKAWNERFLPRGPVGLALLAAARFRVAIDTDLRVRQSGQRSFSITMAPYQFLKHLLRDRVLHFRESRIASTRTELQGMPRIDLKLLRDSFAKGCKGLARCHDLFM